MQFSLEKDDQHYVIHSCSDTGIRVNVPWKHAMPSETGEAGSGILLKRSFIIAPDQLVEWEVYSVQQITPEHVEQWCRFTPEIVILGTGRTQQWPDLAHFAPLYSQNIGIEVMGNDAACRTYNLLTSDLRKVLAAVIIE